MAMAAKFPCSIEFRTVLIQLQEGYGQELDHKRRPCFAGS
jgi:hypothetical protein